ncbi:P-loop NTPase family protein [Desertihabitans aurantiacus]|uniref:shikimate kinase n=1 Tax=Desertihabitans aurantiacus TaxID=2282477 RepID=UPI000DF7F518|nr:shikimate kinase [Desertihabitans aurantiacus]
MDLVFLHGVAAAGKLTVARALAARLHYGVFHNHLVVDALTAVFPFGSPPFVDLRERFWLATFARAAAADVSLVFTFAPEVTVQPGFPERARRSVEDEGGRVHFVELVLDPAEQERRIGLPSRHEVGKLTDLETLRRLRRSAVEVERPPVDLRIDTGTAPPEEAADRIIAALDLRPVPAWEPFPS